MSNFSELGLSDALLKALPELNIEVPSKIQQQAIPILVKEPHKDFIGLAQTGTGKTAAFGLPLLQAVDLSRKATQALILSPTRELGQQIAQQMQAYGKYMKGAHIQVVYGGAPIMTQIKLIKNNTPHIVIATPGRLLDLIKRKAINLGGVKHVVLDEADEMLNMGFRDDLDDILSFTSGEKATWLFSATMAGEIRNIVKKYMTSPNEVKIDVGNVVNQSIDHQYINVKAKDKAQLLKHIIELEPGMRGIIFCRTKVDTQNISQELQSKGVPIDALHGDLSQAQRDQVMKKFKNHSLEFLLATDVAARGIDVNDITHVIHLALPDDLEYYTHRSGRTGRAGKKGISLAFVSPSESRKLNFIQKRLNLSFSKYELPDATLVQSKKLNDWANGLIDTEVNEEVAAKFYDEISPLFKKVTKEALIKKLISRESGENKISDLNISVNEQSSSERSGERRERKRHLEDEGVSGFHRLYINIGQIDGMDKKELINLVCEHAKISNTEIGPVLMENKRSYIQVEKSVSKQVEKSLTGIMLGDREIRANRDDIRGSGGSSRREGRRSDGGGSRPERNNKGSFRPERKTNKKGGRRRY